MKGKGRLLWSALTHTTNGKQRQGGPSHGRRAPAASERTASSPDSHPGQQHPTHADLAHLVRLRGLNSSPLWGTTPPAIHIIQGPLTQQPSALRWQWFGG